VRTWLPRIDHSPEAMTNRARGYMGVVAARHLLVGVLVFATPDRFKSASFTAITSSWPLWAWGLVSLAVGLLAGFAAVWRREALARVGLIASATFSGLVFIGLFIAVFSSPVAGVMGVVIFGAVTAKDLIVCQDPIRAPFEALARRRAPIRSE